MPLLDIVDNYIGILNECKISESLPNAKRIHVHMCSQGLEAHRALENYLVPLFVQCGSLPHAQQVFDRLICRNVHSWTFLIQGYADHGHLQQALDLYITMQEEFTDHSRITVLSLLKACARLTHLVIGQKVHREVIENGFGGDLFVASSLVDMYASCGLLGEAQDVFNELPVRDVAVYNALITGYADNELGRDALLYLDQLHLDGLSANEITFVSCLKACINIEDIDKGREIYIEAVKKGFEENYYIGNTSVNMFASYGLIVDAQDVFNKATLTNVITWIALISGCVDHGFAEEALQFFQLMCLESDAAPDVVTFVCCLKACSSLCAIDVGRCLHAQIVVQELESSVYIGSALVDVYAKCGLFAEALDTLTMLPFQDPACWNALIAGYVEHGASKKALNCLQHMQTGEVLLNASTLVICLKACGMIGAIKDGQRIHREIAEKGFDVDPFVGNALLDMYGTCGWLPEARSVFGKLLVRDVVSWNALITCYAENGFAYEALACFDHMQSEGVLANSTTFVSRLKACGTLGAIHKGREIHVEIAKDGFESNLFVSNIITESVFVSTALIDMYGKCGSMVDAKVVFDEMPLYHLVTWNALISGYTCHGESKFALQLFERMRCEGVQPDSITYLSVLNSCSHTGILHLSQEYFEAMCGHSIATTIKHHNCMVDLLCRAGRVSEALSLVEIMPLQPDQVTWTLILNFARVGSM